MKRPLPLPLLLPLLLLGTVAALRLGHDAPHLDSQETQAELRQDLEGSGEQEGELALTEEVTQSEGEQVKAAGCDDDVEDEKAMESDPSALDENLECPSPEDTVEVLGSPGCKTCRYVLVRKPRTFAGAQNACRSCYRGHLASIHNQGLNYRLQCMTSGMNQQQVWIGATVRGWCKRLRWTDGSTVNFKYWASGQPWSGVGHCVTLCTRGGHWRRARCARRLPFICSI